jgi:hypothetical protein
VVFEFFRGADEPASQPASQPAIVLIWGCLWWVQVCHALPVHAKRMGSAGFFFTGWFLLLLSFLWQGARVRLIPWASNWNSPDAYAVNT